MSNFKSDRCPISINWTFSIGTTINRERIMLTDFLTIRSVLFKQNMHEDNFIYHRTHPGRDLRSDSVFGSA